MEPEVINEIALASGGVLRELVRITIRCCRICLTQIRQDLSRNNFIITTAVLAEACKELRLEFERPLGRLDYNTLVQVNQNFLAEDVQQQEFLTLLHGLYVLEYCNDEVWYDLHPIVIDLLRRKKMIN
jgi:hypothetical protein